MKRPGYMMIKEAAARYEVSRAKLHRLVRLGRLRTSKDRRDERITLLRTDDLEELFRFPLGEDEDMEYGTEDTNSTRGAGRLTAEACASMDALRMRIAGGRKLAKDSVDIIREERERRSQQLYRADSSGAKVTETKDRYA